MNAARLSHAIVAGSRDGSPPGGAGLVLRRKCACGTATSSLTGECDECRKAKRLGVRAKLTVGAPDDVYEREADRAAEQVMRRQDAGGLSASLSSVHRAPAADAASSIEAPDTLDRVVRSPGQPLDPKVRAFMEPRFDHGFGRVEVHTGAEAAASARAVDALAYTVGHHVVFGEGQYVPTTPVGMHLLAHELAHVVQQEAPMSRDRNERVQRQEAQKPASCSGWTCLADLAECDRPDPGKTGNGAVSTSWSLSAMIDVDVATPQEVGITTFGHSYVKFNESNGTEYTYGFYPVSKAEVIFGSVRPTPGCIVHPDVTHTPCIDYVERFTLSQAEYDKALSNAKLWCHAKPTYELFDTNCTTFVAKVVEAAGKSLPTYRGQVSKGKVTADNPNTLLDSLKARDAAKGGAAPAPADPVALANEIIGMIRFSQTRWVFSRLNGMWMVVMLDTLDEVHKKKYLNHLFDFFSTAEDVNKPRLTAAMRAVRLKSSVPKPTPAQIQEILTIDPALPAQQKQEIEAYLTK